MKSLEEKYFALFLSAFAVYTWLQFCVVCSIAFPALTVLHTTEKENYIKQEYVIAKLKEIQAV